MCVSCIKTQVLWISGKMHVSFVKNLQIEFLLEYGNVNFLWEILRMIKCLRIIPECSISIFVKMWRYFSCYRWEGEGVNEVGKDKATGVVRVRVNPKYYRPTEVVRVIPLCSLPPNQCCVQQSLPGQWVEWVVYFSSELGNL